MLGLIPVYDGVGRDFTFDSEKGTGSINPVAELEKVVKGITKTRAFKKVCHLCNYGILVCRCEKVSGNVVMSMGGLNLGHDDFMDGDPPGDVERFYIWVSMRHLRWHMRRNVRLRCITCSEQSVSLGKFYGVFQDCQ